MEWIEVSIDTTHEGIEPVCLGLAMLGIDNLRIHDKSEFTEMFMGSYPHTGSINSEFIAQLNSICKVMFYLPTSSEETLYSVKESISRLPGKSLGTNLGSLAISSKIVVEEDWAENWKQYYKPLQVGERLLIQPEWLPVAERGERSVFLNNPGMAFGTGEHATTMMCLEQIERFVAGGERVLDVGCGSGILSICALLLGAEEADAVDVDPIAVAAARQNARINGFVSHRYRAALGDLLDQTFANSWPGPYQLITVNILADVIVSLSPLLCRRLSPDGRLIASGVIESEREVVQKALTDSGFSIEEEKAYGNWHCFTARRR